MTLPYPLNCSHTSPQPQRLRVSPLKAMEVALHEEAKLKETYTHVHAHKTAEAKSSEKAPVQKSSTSRRNPPARPGTRNSGSSVVGVLRDEGKADPRGRPESASVPCWCGCDLAHVPNSHVVLGEHVVVAQGNGGLWGGDPHGGGTRLLDPVVEMGKRP